MKVKKIYIKEFKCFKDFEADLDGRDVLLVGDNGVGKSSLTQLIKIALGDKNHIPANAKGEGIVIMDKEGAPWKFSVKIKEGKSVVEIESPDGMRDSRKGSLSALVGNVEFDINEFVELSKTKAGQKKQVEIFKQFLTDDVRKEIARYEANVEANYNDRTGVNKDIVELKAEIKANPLNFMSDEALNVYTKTDTKNLSEQLKAASDFNKDKRAPVVTRMEERLKNIEKLKKEIEELEGLNREAEKWLKENPEKETADLEAKIANASSANEKYEHAQALIKKRGQLIECETRSGELTANIDSSRQAIRDAIRDMVTPVEGLSFEGDMLMYNGIEVSDSSLSTSEIEELGIRLKMAENPELGIMFIGKAESIGKERMERILKIAKEKNMQVIGEQVERQDNKKLIIQILEG